MSTTDLCEYCRVASGEFDFEAGHICSDCLQTRQLIKNARAERYHDKERIDTFCC